MGNKCGTCVSQTGSTDEAEDALLGGGNQEGEERREQQGRRRGRGRRREIVNTAAGSPLGPPPPYQVSQVHPFYMLTEEQRLHIIARITLIQSLPVGRYETNKKMPLEKGEGEGGGSGGATGIEKKMDKSDTNRECPICMNDFLPGEVIRLLPCMHFYHIRCIDDWLMRATTCPTCVQRIDAVPCSPTHQFRPQHRRSNSQSSTSSTRSSTRTSRDALPCSPSHLSPPLSSPSPLSPPFSSPQEFTFQPPQQQSTTTSVEIH